MIPLFNQYKIKGIKSKDFQDFCKVAELINKKAYLRIEGLKEIQLIKLRINKNRYF